MPTHQTQLLTDHGLTVGLGRRAEKGKEKQRNGPWTVEANALSASPCTSVGT